MAEVKQLLVQTTNPEMLDDILQHFRSALEQDSDGSYVMEGDWYVARVFGDVDFVRFALETQGYAKVGQMRDLQS